MPVENTPIGSNPDAPQTIVCFDPHHHDRPCPICHGLGLIRYDVDIDDARFGKLYRCPNNPVEHDVEHRERLRRLSNLEAMYDKTFASFELNLHYLPPEQASLKFAFEVASNFADKPQGWLLLEGRYGCGKTHLAAAVAHRRLEKGEQVLFMTVPDLLDHLRGAYAPDAESTYDELFDRMKNAALLVLDDLGVENPSPWAQEKLFQLLNYRYTYKKSTIITTNKNIDDLDQRLRSRLLDVDLVRRVKISAPDYRTALQSDADPLLSNLSIYENMSFDTFDTSAELDKDRQNLGRALWSAKQFAENPQGWLLITGTFGGGKTHLAAAIANFRRPMGSADDIAFVTVPDLLDYLRMTYAPGSTTTFDRRFQIVRNVPLLVLDDLATESASLWAKEKLFQILDYRYVRRLPTVLTSSKPVDDLDDRVRSRLLDRRICQIVAITARSYALRSR